ncbi:MAG: M23 family metallopeptidase [Clostridia bacterium]|nr:M23 family metallopeptidase [Clostridia bacterium]
MKNVKRIISVIMVIITVFASLSVGAFAASSPTWKINSVTDITETNAKISGLVTFPSKVTVTEGGFFIGSSSADVKNEKNAKKYYDKETIKNTKISVSFLMSKYYGKLKANTTYYYKFYVVANGKKYPSEVKSFKTKATTKKVEPTKICFPLPTNQVWYASTYVGHGEKVTAAYSSVDITLKNGKSCRGYAVYSVEEGKVYHIDSSNGQVTIKHTKKLVTTNGVTYNTWYSLYAHMSNISVKKGATVKRGQQIGKVSDKAAKGIKVTGPHLHFTLASDYNGKGMFNQTSTKSAISPYYVYGFVSKDAKNTSYLVRDTKGPAVTAKLINHKPQK